MVENILNAQLGPLQARQSRLQATAQQLKDRLHADAASMRPVQASQGWLWTRISFTESLDQTVDGKLTNFIV